MIRGLYTSASGMVSSMDKSDTISNNLANLNTTGYKKQETIESEFGKEVLKRIDHERTTIGEIGSGAFVSDIADDFSAGEYEETGNPLDLAISGEGFFAVQTPEGVKYTRNGEFTIDNQNQIVTQDGHPVLGENGALQLPEQGEVVIEDNNVLVDGFELDTLELVNFENPEGLIREGDVLFTAGPEVGEEFAAEGLVEQGFLEGANVNPIEEMTRMIENTRAYEADQKAIQAHDDTLDAAINRVGRTR